MTVLVWSPERIERLRDLYLGQGLSVAQCGRELKISRNAVIGKVTRLGFIRGAASPPPTAWPSERLSELSRLAADGFSLRQAADRLGCAHSTVRRQAGALGVTFRGPPQTPKPAPARPPAITPAMEIVSEPSSGGVTIHQLGFCSCKWPLGDSRREADGLQRFCGEPVDPDARPARVSYCRAHGAQAVASVQPMRRPNVYDPSVVVRRPQREAA